MDRMQVVMEVDEQAEWARCRTVNPGLKRLNAVSFGEIAMHIYDPSRCSDGQSDHDIGGEG